MDRVRAISLLQPWASLVACGAKRLETRSWTTRYRGPLAIHASARFGGGDRASCLREPFTGALLSAGFLCSGDLPLGAVVAVARLAGFVPTGRMPLPDEAERSFGDFSYGRYAWRLEDVRRLPVPIPARGALGLWDWDAPAGWEEPALSADDLNGQLAVGDGGHPTRDSAGRGSG